MVTLTESLPRSFAASQVSFRDLFEQHASQVWRALRYLGVPEADLPDACQEVFLVVHRRLGDFEGRSSLETWLYGIAVRVAASFRRRAHVRREVVQSIPDDGKDADQDEAVQRGQDRARLLVAMAGLEDGAREAFVLFEIEERPMTEVAEILGLPLRTAYARLHQARDAVRKAWTDAEASSGRGRRR